MNRELILYDVYSILLQSNNETITMDKLSERLKCSKKSLYKLFPSKNAMLFEVFYLYKKQFIGLLRDIKTLNSSEIQKLVFQIKQLNQNAKTFFNSHLFEQLKNLKDFNTAMMITEREIYSEGFQCIVDEIATSKNQKERLINILAFIRVSIKRRYTLPNYPEKMNDSQFLETMLTTLLAYAKQENIGLNKN